VCVNACACIASVLQYLWFTKYSVAEKSVYQNAKNYAEVKSEKTRFKLHYTCSDRIFTVLLPLTLFIFLSPLNVTQPKSGVILHPLYCLGCQKYENLNFGL
jgi:hypothetical protein